MNDAEHHEYWECLYNHQAISETLPREGCDMAALRFRQQVKKLTSLPANQETDSAEAAWIMLTSLNRSLYNVILMQLDISLTGCCYACRTHIHAATSNELLIAAGERIIRCYAEELCSSQNRNQLFRKACTYIQNHLEENMTITQLCNQLHVSRSSLCRHFRELTGSSFCDYLKHQRICRARSLLSSTALCIEDIAARCGFQTPAYFATVFKSKTGMTPSDYRRKYGKLPDV